MTTNIYKIPLDPEQQQAYDAMMACFSTDAECRFRNMVMWGVKDCVERMKIVGGSCLRHFQALPGIDIEDTEAWANRYRTFVSVMPPLFDVLSPLHHHVVTYSGDRMVRGQVFTPPHIVNDMVNNVVNDPSFFAEKYVSALDPACGAGAFLLGILRQMEKVKPGSSKRALVVGGDIDPLCCAMTTLQLLTNQRVHRVRFAMMEVYLMNFLHDPMSTKHSWCKHVNNQKAVDAMTRPKAVASPSTIRKKP